MAREFRKPHQQLSLPELALPVELPVVQEAAAHGADDAPEQGPRKAPRKRTARPQISLVKDSNADVASDSPSLPQMPDANETQQLVAPLPARERAEPVDMPPRDGGPEAVREAQEAPLPPSVPALTNPGGDGKNRLRTWAGVAMICAALSMIAALVIGSTQFIETQEQQRQLLAAQTAVLQQEGELKAAEINVKAVELFLRYNDLMLQVNAPALKNARRENRYWKEALAINLLESLFNLTRGKKAWETSIGWALERHGRFIREQRLNCAGYSNEFIRYLEKSFSLKAPAFCKDLGNPELAGF